MKGVGGGDGGGSGSRSEGGGGGGGVGEGSRVGGAAEDVGSSTCFLVLYTLLSRISLTSRWLRALGVLGLSAVRAQGNCVKKGHTQAHTHIYMYIHIYILTPTHRHLHKHT